MWIIWTPMSSVPKKADKLNLSLPCHDVNISCFLNSAPKFRGNETENQLNTCGVNRFMYATPPAALFDYFVSLWTNGMQY